MTERFGPRAELRGMLGEADETAKMLERAQVLCVHGVQHCASLRLARRELARGQGSAPV